MGHWCFFYGSVVLIYTERVYDSLDTPLENYLLSFLPLNEVGNLKEEVPPPRKHAPIE